MFWLKKEKVFRYHISTLNLFGKKKQKTKNKTLAKRILCRVRQLILFIDSFIHAFIHSPIQWQQCLFIIKVCCTESLGSMLSLLLLNLVLKETLIQKELSHKKAPPRGKLNEKKLCKKCNYNICGLLCITKTDEEGQKDFWGLRKPVRTIRTTKWCPCLLNN